MWRVCGGRVRRRRRAHRGAVAEGARRVWRGVGGYGEGTERAERTLGSEGARVRVTLNNGGNGVEHGYSEILETVI